LHANVATIIQLNATNETVTGNVSIGGNITATGNANIGGSITVNAIYGQANTQILQEISDAANTTTGSALAFAIALG
jgi:hypothetical protein